MANVLKYLTGILSKQAVRRGNLAVGIGEEGYGPSSTTGYYAGVTPPEDGFVVYTLGLNNNPKAFYAETEDDLPAIARTLGGGKLTVLEAKNYIVGLANTWILDNTPNNIITDGLILDLNAKNKSSFISNEPITNLQPYPTMLPSVTGSIIKSNATYQSNVGGSNWSWSYYPNSNISPDGGMEWHPDVIDPLGDTGAWLMKKRPGGNSESNWSTSAPGAIDETKDYVVSVWCKTDQANCFRIHINTTKNGSSYWGYGSVFHSGGGEWERLSVVVPKNSGNTSINVTRCQAVYTNITADAYYKYYQVEEGSTPTDFVDGTRSENTTIYDLSGNGNNSTLVNGVAYNNGVLEFDGSNDYIQATSVISPADGPFSVELIYKLTAQGRGGLFERNQGSPYNGWSLGQGGTSIWAFSVSDSYTGGTFLQADYTYPTFGVWYHDIAVFNGSNQVSAYRNGELVDSTTGGTVGNLDTGGVRQPLRIFYRDGGSSPLRGEFVKARIYNKELSVSEVKQNYYGGPIVTDGLVFATDAGNLVSYESGSTVTYSITGSYSGSLNNGVAYSNNNGGSFIFDGTNDYTAFTISPSISLHCLETWFYNENAIPGNDTTIGGPTTYQTMFRFNEDYPMGVNLGAWTNGMTNEAIHIWSTGGSPYKATNTREAVLSGWHHLIFNWNGSYYDIYVDGVQQDVYAHTGGHATLIELNHLTIGSSISPNYSFNGKIPITRVYNKTLSSDEVLQNYNAQKARFGK